jgi:hypothetical protein
MTIFIVASGLRYCAVWEVVSTFQRNVLPYGVFLQNSGIHLPTRSHGRRAHLMLIATMKYLTVLAARYIIQKAKATVVS